MNWIILIVAGLFEVAFASHEGAKFNIRPSLKIWC